MATRRMIAATGWRYHRNGPPAKVLQLEKFRIPFDRTGTDIVVKMIAAPVHRQDKQVIQGTYPIKPATLPAVAGIEGVGIIEEVGSAVKLGLQEGDMVWVNNQSVGTWSSHIVTDAENVDVLPNRADLQIEYLASMSLFHTAHHIVCDYVKLQPGDAVLQTGASSSIAQICQSFVRSRGAKLFQTMNLGRSEHSFLVNAFKSQGAFAVVPYSYVRSNYMHRLLSDLPPPKLMLNHTCGPCASLLLKHLGDGGTCVTYGNTSHLPMQVAAVASITRNLTFAHFFLPQWIRDHSREARMRIHQNVIESMELAQGSCSFRAQRYKMDNDSHFAFLSAWESHLNSRKPILRMVGEYGEWRRPTNEHQFHDMSMTIWDDITQQMMESVGVSDQPASMKYYTPFSDFYSDFANAKESREVGFREVFFKRPNMPRHNTDEKSI